MRATLKTAIATIDDIEALITLLNQLFEQEAEFTPNPELHRQGLAQIIDNPTLGEILVIRDHQSVIGMTTLLYTISTALGARVAILEDMVVDVNHRNSGVGSLLLNDAIDHATRRGCKRITLLTDHDNHQAQQFYLRNGLSASEMRPYRMLLDEM